MKIKMENPSQENVFTVRKMFLPFLIFILCACIPVSCSKQNPEEKWLGWREFVMPEFSEVHKPLDIENNLHLVYGNIAVNEPSAKLDPVLAGMAGRWEGFDQIAAAKIVLVISEITKKGGTAYLYVAQNLQYPQDKKEIHFTVLKNSKVGSTAISWDAIWYVQGSSRTIKGRFDLSYNLEKDTIHGILQFEESSVAQPISFARTSSYTVYKNISAYLNSEPTSESKLKIQTDFASMSKDEILGFYSRQSEFTEPGDFAFMFDGLPASLTKLSDLMQSQVIHPLKAEDFGSTVVANRKGEEHLYPTAEDMLRVLERRNPDGLVKERSPEQRIVASCRYYSVLFTSILRSRGIPARLRYGFATYLQPGKLTSHAICEVWNSSEKRWMLFDPNKNMVAFDPDLFRFAGDLWLEYCSGENSLDACSDVTRPGPYVALDILFHDFYSVMGRELLYYDYALLRVNARLDVKSLPGKQRKIMDRIAELMQQPEENLALLKQLYAENPFLQI
jgi:hypothetical protein